MNKRPTEILAALAVLCVPLLLSTVASAQQQGNAGLIVLDGSITGTVSQPTGGVVPAGDGANYLIIEGYGHKQGDNLFHSFGDFSIGDGELARFTTEGGIDHIISRVTGGNESQLLGRLESEASLFLLNPSGVMFGENASVDVNGSFYTSTADTLNFADGTQFATGSNAPPVSFTAAAPVSFGFLAAAPAGIDVLSNNLCNDCVNAGETFSIVGGDVLIDGQASSSSTIAADGASIEVVSVARGDSANPVVVPLDASVIDVDAAPPGTYGEVRIQNQASVEATGSGSIGSGRIVIRSGQFVLAGSELVVDNRASVAGTATGIDVAASDSIELTEYMGTAAAVSAFGVNTGLPGDIRFRTDQFKLAAGSDIETVALQSPNGADVFIDADQIEIIGTGTPGGTQILSRSFGFGGSGTGNGGHIALSGKAAGTADRAAAVSITDGAQLIVDSQDTTTAGDIGIAAESLTIDAGGRVLTNTTENSASGVIRIDAGQTTVSNSGFIQSLTAGQKKGADIVITGEQLTVRDSAEISTSTTSASVTGDAGDIHITVPEVLVTEGGNILSSHLGQGKGGAIDIVADATLTVLNEGQIRSQTGPETTQIIVTDNFLEVDAAAPPAAPAPREGGDITIQTGRLTVQGRDGASSITQISSVTTAAGGQTGSGDGKGGNVTIDAEQIDLLDGGQLRAVTLGSARAGDLQVTAHGSPGQNGGAPTPGTLTIRGAVGRVTPNNGQSVISTPAGIFATSGEVAPTQATGDGGNALVEADIIEITERGEIQSGTFGDGAGGDLTVIARERLTVQGNVDGNSIISTQGFVGDGGNLVVDVGNGALELLDGGEITVSTLRSGRAGDVGVDAQQVTVQGPQSGIFSQSLFANTTGGDGGTIRIDTGDLTVTDGAQLAARSFGGGNGGAIVVDATNAINIENGASVSAESRLGALNAGAAGNIDLQAAKQVGVDDATVTTRTIDGPGGDIRVSGDEVTIKNEGLVTAQTTGRGDAGSVTIEDGGKFELKSMSRVSAETTGPGNAGRVAILNFDDIQVKGGSEITSESSGIGSGTAGSIEIAAIDEFSLKDRSSVTTSTEDASGGRISIQAGERVYLLDSTVKTNINIAGQDEPEAGAGDINITFSGNEASETSPVTPEFVVINRSTVSANATGDNADAGNIAIEGLEVLISADSVIEATSERGVQGEIEITTPDADVVSQVTPLPTSFTDPSDRLLPPCAARTERTGSFTVQNRASAPPSPDAPLSPSLGTGAPGASPEDFEECSVFEDGA